MRRPYWILAAIVLVLAPWTAFAHAQANHPATPAPAPKTTPAVLPPDQQPTPEQLAKLFQVMRIREQYQSLMKMIPSSTQQQLRANMDEIYKKLPAGQQPTPQQQADLERLMNQYMQKALNIYPIDEMLSDMGTIYQRHLSKTDVDALIAFYGSPAGQHLLDAQPVIMREYMPLVMQRVQKSTAELTDEMMKDAQEVIKPVAPPAGAAPSK